MGKITDIMREDAALILDDLGPALAPLAGSTLLVTGANGFLCSWLVDVAAAWNARNPDRACRILAVDNLKVGLSERLAHLADDPTVTLLTHDAQQPLDWDGPVDWIVHGASIASPIFYRQYPLETIDANVGGTRRLLDLARAKASKGIVIMSTSEIYGDPDAAHIPTAEDYRGSVSCTGPRACYDESKRLSETLSFIYHRQYNVPVKVVRPFNVFGPGQRIDDQRIIPDLMRAALAHQPITLLSDGRATRSFCYVADAVRAIFHILLGPVAGEAFNVGNDEIEISITDLAEVMVAVTGEPKLAVDYQASPDQDYCTDNPQRRCPNLAKLRGTYPWTPRVMLREALTRTLESYRQEAGR